MPLRGLETVEIGVEGNTNQPQSRKADKVKKSKKQDIQRKYWCFTYFPKNRDLEIENFKIFLKSYVKFFKFGEEICPKTKNLHFQGFFELLKKKRFMELLKIFTESPYKGLHFEACKGSKSDNNTYVSKDGIIHEYPEPAPTIKILKEELLYPFQKSILEIIRGPVNENKIIWIYDSVGQLGKTELMRFCFVNYNIPFSYGGKCSDIINLAYNNREILLKMDKPTFIYNLGRDTDPEKVSYKSMEQISDGAISNTKFEGACFVFNKPHVIVLANCLPVSKKLTASRWILKTIKNNELIDFKEEIINEISDLDI